jgi:translation initiation factor 1
MRRTTIPTDVYTMGRLLYSTDQGKHCPDCNQPIAACLCREQAKSAVLGDGNVRISRETKGRKGKGVTLITGLALNEKDLKNLAKQCKQHCGTGGSVKNGIIEIQGEQREPLLALLAKHGIQAKLSGG